MIVDVKKLSKVINLNGRELYFGELKGFYRVYTLLYHLDLLGSQRVPSL